MLSCHGLTFAVQWATLGVCLAASTAAWTRIWGGGVRGEWVLCVIVTSAGGGLYGEDGDSSLVRRGGAGRAVV
jgi:hypothetical protein